MSSANRIFHHDQKQTLVTTLITSSSSANGIFRQQHSGYIQDKFTNSLKSSFKIVPYFWSRLSEVCIMLENMRCRAWDGMTESELCRWSKIIYN